MSESYRSVCLQSGVFIGHSVHLTNRLELNQTDDKRLTLNLLVFPTAIPNRRDIYYFLYLLSNASSDGTDSYVFAFMSNMIIYNMWANEKRDLNDETLNE